MDKRTNGRRPGGLSRNDSFANLAYGITDIWVIRKYRLAAFRVCGDSNEGGTYDW